MKVNELMSGDLVCCTPETPLQQVALKMVQNDCGSIPVCETEEGHHIVGIITDRDIVTRAIAANRNPLTLTAKDCMSHPVATAPESSELDACLNLMEQNQVRRLPIVDSLGACCGMVTQADIALHSHAHQTAELLQQVSKPKVSLL